MRTDLGSRLTFLDIGFDRIDLEGMVATLRRRSADDRCRVVMTPNVDHVVRAHRAAEQGDCSLLDLYRGADWCLCDSRILSRLAKLCGVELPVVPGSDLTKALLERCCQAGDRVAIVGGSTETVARLTRVFPGISFVQHRPPMGLRRNPAALAEAAAFVAASAARFTLLAVGSPQQEMVAAMAARHDAANGTALCIGASLDFLTGAETRAPNWMQRASLEWAYRLGRNPAKMWRRYLIEGPRVFLIAWKWRRQHG